MCNKNHPNADPKYVNIGNNSIIGVRIVHPVKIFGYGNIGDYVPFYFTPCSIMLYNILTGYGIDKVAPEDIIFLCCTVEAVTKCGNDFFFTDGQANTAITEHYNDLVDLGKIDWDVIKSKDFRKTADDVDRQRRYQAEFLIKHFVPTTCISAIVVYNEKCANFVKKELEKAGSLIPVHIKKSYYFNR
ncbi:hypothetical protein A3860_14680 [Niastella vici]|uniref:DarT domain-containing protein n=1 Tax=Niastella vici TaxID=1703345 RepID=A0A1V9G622_9BACT|nr:hypothetical protein A3860_14680 [Niastella vici]